VQKTEDKVFQLFQVKRVYVLSKVTFFQAAFGGININDWSLNSELTQV
jgi:hypothetical protein